MERECACFGEELKTSLHFWTGHFEHTMPSYDAGFEGSAAHVQNRCPFWAPM